MPVALFALIYVIPGWLLSLVPVICMSNLQGWRSALFFFVGVLIGPFVMVCFYWYMAHGWEPSPISDPLNLLATIISALTTVLYLRLSKLITSKRIQIT